MKLANRQKWLLIVAGAVIGLIALDNMVISPLQKHWEARTKEIANLKKLIADGKGVLSRGPRTQALWNEMQAGAMPNDSAQAEQQVLSAFDEWGRVTGAELASIKPQWRRGTSDRYSLLECRVDASGSLSTLTRFLHEVEKSPLALRVDALELTSRDEAGGRLTLGLTVSGLRFGKLEVKK